MKSRTALGGRTGEEWPRIIIVSGSFSWEVRYLHSKIFPRGVWRF